MVAQDELALRYRPTTRSTAPAAPDAHRSHDLQRALAELPRIQRAVLVLRYFDDLTIKAVADLLDIPRPLVSSHASRGLAALRNSAPERSRVKP